MLYTKYRNNKHEAYVKAFTDVDSAKNKFFQTGFRKSLKKVLFFLVRIYFRECDGNSPKFLPGKISPFKVEYTRTSTFISSKYRCKWPMEGAKRELSLKSNSNLPKKNDFICSMKAL